MTSPEDFSAYDAADPSSDPAELALIAEHRPELRPLVAANPSTPPEVLRRLSTLGDVAVDAALRRRSAEVPRPVDAAHGPGAASPDTPPPDPRATPAADPYASAGPADPYAAPPARPAGHHPGQPSTPYTGAPFGPSGGTPFGLPAGGAPFGPPGGTPFGPPGGGAPFGPGPAAGYQDPAYQAAPWETAAPEERRGGVVRWIIVGAVAAIAVLALVIMNLMPDGDPAGPVLPTDVATGTGGASDAFAYGDDPYFDDLWDGCEAGDALACDTLFQESPVGSDYEEFGASCGGRFPGTEEWCVDVM